MAVLCRVLGVSRSGYYAWRSREPSPAEVRRKELTDEVKEIHVLTTSKRPAKQIVRDVQTLLATRFNQTIDHRVVSVAYTDNAPAEPTAMQTTTARLSRMHQRAITPRRAVVPSRVPAIMPKSSGSSRQTAMSTAM